MSRTIGIASIAALVLLLALAGCGGSTHGATLRLFDPTGGTHSQVSLYDINLRTTTVTKTSNATALALALTNIGEQDFCHLTRSVVRRAVRAHRRRAWIALAVNDHVDARFYLDTRYIRTGLCHVQSVPVRMKAPLAQHLARIILS
jgi:hypothetical protein